MKNTKSYLAILLAITLLLSLALVSASCSSPESGDGSETTTPEETTPKSDESTTPKEEESSTSPDDDKMTYTVTVRDGNGAPIEGVRLQICSKTTGTCFVPPLLTDANGVATTSRVEDAYEISIAAADGYEFDKNVKFGFADGETALVITLEPKVTE